MTGGRGRRPISRLRAAIGRLLGADRVLQLDEVVAAVAEHLDTACLRGLEVRYLPAAFMIQVAAEDRRFLAPFAGQLEARVRDEVCTRAVRPDWAATVAEVEVELAVARELAPGAMPRVTSSYSPGARRARWSPTQGKAPSSAPGAASDDMLRVVVTMSHGDGTALQERWLVCLGPELRAAALRGAAAAEAARLRVDDNGQLVTGEGAPWSPPDDAVLEILPALPGEPGAIGPAGVWARGRTRDGAPLLWCPAGALVVGRGEGEAQLVPDDAPQALSRRHLVIARGGGGGLTVTDLDSTNGTFVAGLRLVAREPSPLERPGEVMVGGLGAVRIRVE